MGKILAATVMVILITPFALSQAGHDRASKRDGNVERMAMKMERETASQCTLTFITENLPDFTLDVPANFQLVVCCGTPPYRFEIVQGTLPSGLNFNQNGKITGKPREVADTTVFFRVTDSAGCSLTQAFQVRVVAP